MVDKAEEERQRIVELARASRLNSSYCYNPNPSRTKPRGTRTRALKNVIPTESLCETNANISPNIVPAVDTSNAEDDLFFSSAPKIFFCMRTHSQISQFAKEALKVKLDDVIGVCIGSRLNMCINESVNRYKGIDIINKKCMDLLKSISCSHYY